MAEKDHYRFGLNSRKRGPRCDTLFEKWRPEALAHMKEHGPFTPEVLLLWAFREGFKARGDRDRSQSDAFAEPK